MRVQTGSPFIIALLMLCSLSPVVSAAAQGFPGDLRDAFGSRFAPVPRFEGTPSFLWFPGREAVRRWNQIAIDASGLDHTPVAPGENRVFGEQIGPGRASRAMAIVHIAIFDAVNAIMGGYQSYTGLEPAPWSTSLAAAVAQAAHDTLVVLFPSQKTHFKALLAEDLDRIWEGRHKRHGIALGQRAAAAILALRAHDGSHHAEPRMGIEFIPGNDPGEWRQDPISLIPLALGAYWGGVTPFVLDSPQQFRVPPPPALTSRAYTAAFHEVQRLGGDGRITPTTRTKDQTLAGIYWAYDGTPSLCAPPRLYNQIAISTVSPRRLELSFIQIQWSQ